MSGSSRTRFAICVLGLFLTAACTVGALALGGVFDSDEEPRGFVETLGVEAGYEKTTGYRECKVEVVPSPQLLEHRWPAATDTASIVCLTEDGFADGAMSYARFPDDASRQQALAEAPAEGRLCTFDAIVVVEVDASRFDEMCAAHNGQVSG
jgi:hypothetical protein